MRKVVWTSVLAMLVLTVPSMAGASTDTAGKPRKHLDKRVERRLARLDQNKNGVIDRSEWTRNAKRFDRFDTDHNGTLDRQELRRMLAAKAKRLK